MAMIPGLMGTANKAASAKAVAPGAPPVQRAVVAAGVAPAASIAAEKQAKAASVVQQKPVVQQPTQQPQPAPAAAPAPQPAPAAPVVRPPAVTPGAGQPAATMAPGAAVGGNLTIPGDPAATTMAPPGASQPLPASTPPPPADGGPTVQGFGSIGVTGDNRTNEGRVPVTDADGNTIYVKPEEAASYQQAAAEQGARNDVSGAHESGPTEPPPTMVPGAYSATAGDLSVSGGQYQNPGASGVTRFGLFSNAGQQAPQAQGQVAGTQQVTPPAQQGRVPGTNQYAGADLTIGAEQPQFRGQTTASPTPEAAQAAAADYLRADTDGDGHVSYAEADAMRAQDPSWNPNADPAEDAAGHNLDGSDAGLGGAVGGAAGQGIGQFVNAFTNTYNAANPKSAAPSFQAGLADVAKNSQFTPSSLVGDVGQNWTSAMDPAAWEQMAKNKSASLNEGLTTSLNSNERRLNAHAAASGLGNTGGQRTALYNADAASRQEGERNIFNDTLGQQMQAMQGASSYALGQNAQDQARWQTLFGAGSQASAADIQQFINDNPSAAAVLRDLLSAGGQAAQGAGSVVGSALSLIPGLG